MPKLLNVSASFLAGNPAAGGTGHTQGRWIEGISRRRCNFAIQRHARLQCDQWQAGKNMASERFIDPARFCFEQAGLDNNSDCAKLFESLSCNFRIWINHGRNYTLNACSNQHIGARRRAPLMAMRFKVEINGRSSGARSRLLQGQNLSVFEGLKCIRAFANDLPTAIYNYRANASAGRCKSSAATRKVKRLAHEVLVLFRKCHGCTMADQKLIRSKQGLGKIFRIKR